MTKYSAELKLYLVQAYDSQQLSSSEIRERFGVHPRLLLNWHQRFSYHGVAAFTKKHSHYDAKFKLHVLLYQQQHDLSGHETVALFNIRGSSGVVSRWRAQYDLGGIQALEPKPKGRPAKMPVTKSSPPKKRRLNSLPSEQQRVKELETRLTYLEAENEYLKKLDALLQQKAQTQKIGQSLKRKRK